jgi:thymidine phosphorylase
VRRDGVTVTLLAQEIIRVKRDGGALDAAQIDAFVAGLAAGGWSDAQCAAMAMAIFLQGFSTTETVALTRAMTHSGAVMDWAGGWLARAGAGQTLHRRRG